MADHENTQNTKFGSWLIMRMSQIRTMDHGTGSWSKSEISDHDHGPDHDLLDHGPMSSYLWVIVENCVDLFYGFPVEPQKKLSISVGLWF